MKSTIIAMLLLLATTTFAQVGIGTTSPHASSVLELKSDAAGLLPPRMSTTEINNITSTATGLIVYNQTLNCLQTNSGLPTAPRWECVIENNRDIAPITQSKLSCNNDLTINSKDVIENSYVVVYPKEGNVFSDASCSADADNGDVVNCLGNFATAGLNFQVPTGSNGPTLVSPGAAATNQEPYLSFNSTNNNSMYLDNPDAAAGDPFELFMYFRFDASTGESGTILGVANTGSDPGVIFGSGTGNTWQLGRGVASSNTEDDFVFRYSPNSSTSVDIPVMPWTDFAGSNFRFLTIKYAGGDGEINIYVDGVLEATATIDTDDNVGLAQGLYRFGVNRAYNNWAIGDLAELNISKPSLTEEQFRVAQAYFLCKYGLDASTFSEPGPFGVLEKIYDGKTQFEYQEFRNPKELTLADGKPATAQEFVYDALNNGYYLVSAVPTPGLGITRNIVQSSITQSILPERPSTGGPYKLQLIVDAGGAGTLQWVQVP